MKLTKIGKDKIDESVNDGYLIIGFDLAINGGIVISQFVQGIMVHTELYRIVFGKKDTYHDFENMFIKLIRSFLTYNGVFLCYENSKFNLNRDSKMTSSMEKKVMINTDNIKSLGVKENYVREIGINLDYDFTSFPPPSVIPIMRKELGISGFLERKSKKLYAIKVLEKYFYDPDGELISTRSANGYKSFVDDIADAFLFMILGAIEVFGKDGFELNGFG